MTLEALGFTADVAHAFAPHAQRDRWPGRVRRIVRSVAWVDPGDGELRRCTVPPRTDVAIGDWVAVEASGRVAAVLPRRCTLSRKVALDQRAAAQVLAANVDLVGLVHAHGQPLRRRRLEREFVLALDSGAEPLVVLTKADLVDDATRTEAERVAADVAHGARVVSVSIPAGTGLDALAAVIAGHTAVLIGASGTGKSSLTNALTGTAAQTTGEIRDDGRGRHTTIASQLFVLPGGGVIIDTPGLRSLALWLGDADDLDALDAAFPDVAGVAEGCHFRDCVHDGEPGCAVQAALDAGTLRPERVGAWQKLRTELASVGAARVKRERDHTKRLNQRSLRRAQAVTRAGDEAAGHHEGDDEGDDDPDWP